MFVYPVGVISLIRTIGSYAIVYGLLIIFAAFQLDRFQKRLAD
jgi:hypothetical protein